jgi:phospholipid transport system substrate-binding protein
MIRLIGPNRAKIQDGCSRLPGISPGGSLRGVNLQKNLTICWRRKGMLWRLQEGKFFFALVVLFPLLVSPQFTCADAPSQSNPKALIQSGTEKVLQILHESESGHSSSLRQRKNEILNNVSDYFNFDEMAKRALGRPWKDQTPDKRQEFVQLFKQLIFNTYINRLENYTGSKERVFHDSEKLDGDYAIVKTHILYQGNNNIDIEYRFHRDVGEWKVYDVVVEGISIVENYRSQFGSILTNESFDSLLIRLRQKVDQSS